MTGQYQIEPMVTLSLYPRRIMHQQNGFCPGIQRRRNVVETPAGDAHQVDFSAGHRLLFVEQPSAAGGRKAPADDLERRTTPIIVISGYTKHGRFDAGKNFQRLGQEPGLLHNVAGETHQIRREGVDGLDDRFCIGVVALVMQVGKMNEADGGWAIANTQVPDLQPRGFKPSGIRHCGHRRAGTGRTERQQKMAAAESGQFHCYFSRLGQNHLPGTIAPGVIPR